MADAREVTQYLELEVKRQVTENKDKLKMLKQFLSEIPEPVMV